MKPETPLLVPPHHIPSAIHIIQEFSEPRWIVNHNVREKNGSQWNDDCGKVHQQYAEGYEDTIFHSHGLPPND